METLKLFFWARTFLVQNSIFVILLLRMVWMEKYWNFKNLDVIAFLGKINLWPYFNSISMNVECTAKSFNDSKLIFKVPKQLCETQPMVKFIILL